MAKRKRIPLSPDALLGHTRASEPWNWLKHDGLWLVYTIHEEYGRLKVPLYVGVTNNCRNRLAQHRRDKLWWPLAGQIDLYGFYTDRASAYEAEEQQIHALRPLMNHALGDV